MTFSIVAAADGSWGVACASRFLASAALVCWARAGAGAIATQAQANVSYGPTGLGLLAAGWGAAEVIEALTGPDDLRPHRQVGVVDAAGRAATYTGERCIPWAGGLAGEGFACQGNILAGPEVLEAMAAAYASCRGDLASRLVAALRAGDEAGGDRRGRQSAGLVVVSPSGGYGGTTDKVVDLRVDDHPRPVEELERLLALHRLYFTKPAPADLLALDADLRAEVASLLRAAGFLAADGDLHAALERFCGWENLEERLVGGEVIDRHVLEALRAAASAGGRRGWGPAPGSSPG